MARTLLIDINGREALPVRAIPFVTGWIVTPDRLVEALSESEQMCPRLAHGLRAHKFDQDCTLTLVLPKEWDGFSAALTQLEDELKAAYADDESGYAVWRSRAAFVLPAGVFVWRDEFEAAFHKAQKKIIYLDEREGLSELVYAPVLPSGFHDRIFEELSSRSGNADELVPAPVSRRQSHEQKILHAIRARGEDPLALPKPPPGKSGVKAAVRESLGKTITASAFRKTWDEMRQLGVIQDSKDT